MNNIKLKFKADDKLSKKLNCLTYKIILTDKQKLYLENLKKSIKKINNFYNMNLGEPFNNYE